MAGSEVECVGQGSRTRPFNNPSLITYVDATLSTQKTLYGICTTPIQGGLSARDKIGIGIGGPAAVAMLATVGFWGFRWWKVRIEREESMLLDDGSPPAYPAESTSK
ncbi:uncharacterized protein ATNIH1004_003692 [Aspergillus tanneri]|uniref:Uncharacterized protein n=1 Tax=Aspergillus tanneri TaxID=1220188 RepID=A0A5M9MV61_9EURO|nr:uncharacterized protein ATNIH1004_003692 [Aspergillus tanneri]KAA8651001.1 hypothetical protein ATNIH1004_003692 [Aspergillus tanneri]